MTDKLSISDINAIADENDIKILEVLGLEPDMNGDIQSACPIHDGDNPTAFSYNHRIKRWRCWTHHCHEQYGTGIIGLIRSIKNCNMDEAIKLVSNCVNIDQVNIKHARIQKLKRKLNHNNPVPVTVYDSKILDTLNHDVSYFLNRGFTSEILHKFKAFQSTTKNKPLYGRACLPIFDDEDNLVAFAGRANGNYHPKWMYMPSEIKLSNYLFGLNHCKNYLSDKKVAILTEGTLDFLKIYQYGVYNTVATFTSSLSKKQVKLLLKYNVETLILGFDPDEAGIKGNRKIKSEYSKYFNIVDVSNEMSCDPGDMTEEQVLQIFKVTSDRYSYVSNKRYEIKL